MTSAPRASAIAIERARRVRFCSSVRTILSGFSAMSSPACGRCSSRRTPEQAGFGQQYGEEDEEIENGESEKVPRCTLGLLALSLAAHSPRQCNHGSTC